MNTKIALSTLSIFSALALVGGATFAFFSDTETSTGNTFTAGSLDLKVDNECHYNEVADLTPNCPEPPEGVTTWSQTDLGPAHKFFYFTDIKPGDFGEDTISLHVLTNDAWGRLTVDNVDDFDNLCTETEEDSTDTCTVGAPEGTTPGSGELAEAITFDAWLDQGAIAGFQCNDPGVPATAGSRCDADSTEGDNIHQQNEGPLFWDDETVDEVSEGPFDISDVLSAAYSLGECTDVDGNTDYGTCHGLALDGRMVGSATYYFGLAWNVPETVGDEAQTDSLTADMVFEVEQWRNNLTPFVP